MTIKHVKNSRWYDSEPVLAWVVDRLQVMPLEEQSVFSQVVIGLCERVTIAQREAGELLQLGSQKVLGLLKAQAKQRRPDQNKQLYKTFQSIYLLSDMAQVVIAKKVATGIEAVEQYRSMCQNKSRLENPKEIAQLIQRVLKQGPAAGQNYLKTLKLVDETDGVPKPQSNPKLELKLDPKQAPEVIELPFSEEPPLSKNKKAVLELRENTEGLKIYMSPVSDKDDER